MHISISRAEILADEMHRCIICVGITFPDDNLKHDNTTLTGDFIQKCFLFKQVNLVLCLFFENCKHAEMKHLVILCSAHGLTDIFCCKTLDLIKADSPIFLSKVSQANKGNLLSSGNIRMSSHPYVLALFWKILKAFRFHVELRLHLGCCLTKELDGCCL